MLSSRLYSFSAKEFPRQCTESCSHERCHDKEPELFDGLSAFHQAGPMLRAGFTDVP